MIIFAGPALEELRAWANQGGRLLFPSPKNPEKPIVGIPRLFAKTLEAARIELKDPEFRMRWHDWGHMCASYLSLDGCNAFTVAEILGHSSIAMTQRYQNLTTERRSKMKPDEPQASKVG